MSRLLRAPDAARWQQELEGRQRYYTARQALLEQLWARPDDCALNGKLARLVGLHGDVEECVRRYSIALRQKLDSVQVMIAAAGALTAGGHAAQAYPLAARAVRYGNANPSAHEVMGDALLGLDRPAEAATEYNKTLVYSPDRSRLLKARLAAYFAAQAKRPGSAESCYQEARRLQAEEVGQDPIAEKRIRQLARQAHLLDPTDPVYIDYLMDLAVADRRFDAAIDLGKQSLAVAPTDAHAHATLAALLVERASTPEELAEVERHLQYAAADPAYAATRSYGLGLLDMKRRLFPLAAAALRDAARRDPQADIIYYKLSLAEAKAGDPQDAERAMAFYRSRLAEKRQESRLLDNIIMYPKERTRYERAAHYFESLHLPSQAAAIRAAERQHC